MKLLTKFSGVTPLQPPQKTGLRPVDGRFAPVLLTHSNIPPPHQTFLDSPLSASFIKVANYGLACHTIIFRLS